MMFQAPSPLRDCCVIITHDNDGANINCLSISCQAKSLEAGICGLDREPMMASNELVAVISDCPGRQLREVWCMMPRS